MKDNIIIIDKTVDYNQYKKKLNNKANDKYKVHLFNYFNDEEIFDYLIFKETFDYDYIIINEKNINTNKLLFIIGRILNNNKNKLYILTDNQSNLKNNITDKYDNLFLVNIQKKLSDINIEDIIKD